MSECPVMDSKVILSHCVIAMNSTLLCLCASNMWQLEFISNTVFYLADKLSRQQVERLYHSSLALNTTVSTDPLLRAHRVFKIHEDVIHSLGELGTGDTQSLHEGTVPPSTNVANLTPVALRLIVNFTVHSHSLIISIPTLLSVLSAHSCLTLPLIRDSG